MAINRSLIDNPRLSRWIGARGDGRIEVRTGKVELGQGVVTALAQMGAAELGVAMAELAIVSGDTATCPFEWYTSGSQSIEVGGLALRVACAHARRLVIDRAARRLDVDPGGLDVVAGEVTRHSEGTGLRFADALAALQAEGALEIDIDTSVALRPVGEAPLVGQSVHRIDLREKLTGGGFIHDLRPEGLLVGRVLRAPSEQSRLASIDAEAMRRLPGVIDLVVDGSFVGILAEGEAMAWNAHAAAQALCRWDAPEALPRAARPAELFAAEETVLKPVIDTGVPSLLGDVSLSATYTRSGVAHASIGPSCAIAVFEAGGYRVDSHSQGVFALRDSLARVLGVAAEKIQVRHVAGAGCYGHNGADDVALDACLLARLVPGRPVKVTWSREDELAASPMGSPMAMRIDARLDAGRIVDWHYQVWSGPHGARPGWNGGVNLLAAHQMAEPHAKPIPEDVPPEIGGGGDRNATAIYRVGRHKVDYHFAPKLALRTSSLRALGGFANVFAIESFMDELAGTAGQDALTFRLAHLEDPRARTVLETAAARAGWRGGPTDREGTFQGLAMARYKNKAAYMAVVCELTIADEVSVGRIVGCVDAGLAINPDGLRNQVEGGLIQALSWALMERMRWSSTRVEVRSWRNYPILRFAQVPRIELDLIDRPDQPPLGVGECAHGPMAAALANALAAGLGFRVRDLPLDQESIMAAAAA